MQAEGQPKYPLLYSLQGFQYGELLLAEAERAAWGGSTAAEGREACAQVAQRAAQTLAWAETNQPESGIPIIALAGITISKFPKVFSSRLKLSFIVGILEAQVEKQIPERRKYAERAILCFCLFSNSFISSAKLRQSVLKIRIFFHQILIKI
jgi:hypothetical protein